jgi:hypothetical protein
LAEPPPADRFEDERRRLAGMLPGAEIEWSTQAAGTDVTAFVAELDAPIAVLVERGGYVLDPGRTGALVSERYLRRNAEGGEIRLTLRASAGG